MAIQLKSKSDIVAYPYGTYLARLKDVRVENKQPDQYHSEPYQQLTWMWEMKVPTRPAPVQYTTWTSLSLSPKSHLPGLLKALGLWKDGMDSFEPMDAIGKVCQLLVEEYANGAGEQRNRTKVYLPRAVSQTNQSTPTASVGQTVAAPIQDEDPFGDVSVNDDLFADDQGLPF